MPIQQPNPFSNTNIHWPVLIQLSESDELFYLSSQQYWTHFIAQNQHNLFDTIYINDITGSRFSLNISLPISSPIKLISTQALTTKQLTQAVQRYAQYQQQCCVSKININDMREAMTLVEQLSEID